MKRRRAMRKGVTPTVEGEAAEEPTASPKWVAAEREK